MNGIHVNMALLTAKSGFQLPLSFIANLEKAEHGRAVESLDLKLAQAIFSPWSDILEWMFHQGELVDCSPRLLCALLPMDEALVRRRDLPSTLRQGLEQAIKNVADATYLNRSQLIQHWNEVTVPTMLIPAIKALAIG